MLRQRVVSAVVFLPVIFVAIWFGAPWFSILVAIAALLGIIEFYTIFTKERWHPITFFGTLLTLLFICNAHYAYSYNSENTHTTVTTALVSSAVVLSLPVAMLLRKPGERASLSWAWSLAGIFYMGWLLSYWVLIMNSPEWDGRDWVFIALFSTFAVDTGAYFIGRAFGRRKLAPSISPGKTWEGAFGGAVAGIIMTLVLSIGLDIGVSYGKMAFIGLLIGVFAQIGDLAESKIKRSAGIKESGNLIPGHGGIMDRLDSVVLTGVVVYYCLRWFVG
jgi:phosphatidate cytidylyltransferase